MVEQKQHRTTERVLDIIEFVSTNSNGMTFSEIAAVMDIPKSSLHPLLHTLSQRRYIHFNADNQRYFMGETLYSLGQRYGQNTNIQRFIQTEMTTLSEKLSETSFFGVLSRADITYLLKGEPNIPIRIVTASVGSRNPAHSTALGKSILMSYTKDQLKELYPDTLPAKTEHTITSLDTLYDEIQKMKEEGFAYEKEESTNGIQCLAVPINYNNITVAALSVSVPVYRFSTKKSKDIKTELINTKHRIEGIILMNYQEWTRCFSI